MGTRTHPIREKLRQKWLTQKWLARQIGKNEGYTRGVIAGFFPAIPAFRADCAKALGLPESDLFLPDDPIGSPVEQRS